MGDRQNRWDWKSEAFYRLKTKEVDEANASISLISPFGAPISYPYWNDKVTVNIPATYNATSVI